VLFLSLESSLSPSMAFIGSTSALTHRDKTDALEGNFTHKYTYNKNKNNSTTKTKKCENFLKMKTYPSIHLESSADIIEVCLKCKVHNSPTY